MQAYPDPYPADAEVRSAETILSDDCDELLEALRAEDGCATRLRVHAAADRLAGELGLPRRVFLSPAKPSRTDLYCETSARTGAVWLATCGPEHRAPDPYAERRGILFRLVHARDGSFRDGYLWHGEVGLQLLSRA